MAMAAVFEAPGLWYEVAGDGPPMVMLPGGPGLSHDYLRPHLDGLSDVATQVWLDLPGTGRSPVDDTGSITHELWIDELEGLRRDLGHERWIVFGHSYGGWLALEYTLTVPGSISGLVLSASSPSAAHLATLMDRAPVDLAPDDRRLLDQLLAGVIEDDELEASVRETTRIFLRREADDSILESIRLNPETFKHAFGTCLPGLAVEDRLGEIIAPTLVVAADGDWQCPWEASARLAAAIPNAELATMPDAGHYPFIDEPEAFATIVTGWLETRMRE